MNPVDEFLEGEAPIEKQAFNKAEFAAQAALAIGAPIVLGGAALGYQEIKGMINRSRGFKGMMAYNPSLAKLPAKETKAMFNTLHNVAPNLAQDPAVASSWVNRMAEQSNYVDPRTLADLGSAQRNASRPGLEYPIGPVTTALAGAYGKQREFEQTVRKNDLTAAKDAVYETREQARFTDWKEDEGHRRLNRSLEFAKNMNQQAPHIPK